MAHSASELARLSLAALRDKVSAMQVHACGLSHERVVIEQGVALRRSQGAGLEPLLQRAGLCPSTFRSAQLACAHTSVRHLLHDVIAAMALRGALTPGRAKRMQDLLARVAADIHALDLARNGAEVESAILGERGDPDAVQAQARSHGIGRRHSRAAARLARLRALLLRHIDGVRGTDLVAPAQAFDNGRPK